MRKSRNLSRLKTGSNIIPMINVAFCIMLILMVISPFLSESNVKVDVPEALTTEDQSEKKITLTIASSGECLLEDKKVKLSELPDYLSKQLSTSLDRVMVIKADKNVPYLWIRQAVEMAKAGGIKRIAIGTKKKKSEEAAKKE